MKKILFLGLILTLFAVAASAQQIAQPRLHHQREMQFHRRELSRSELRRLHKDEFRYKMARRKAQADGIVTRAERRHLNKLKKQNRRELYHLNHHRQHVI